MGDVLCEWEWGLNAVNSRKTILHINRVHIVLKHFMDGHCEKGCELNLELIQRSIIHVSSHALVLGMAGNGILCNGLKFCHGIHNN